jgi:hypothetical protein
MRDVTTPWIGLAALVAMFVIPFLPSWLWEGPRTIKHYRRRHVCGDCGAPWTSDHACGTSLADQPLRGQLYRTRPSRTLENPSFRTSRIGLF